MVLARGREQTGGVEDALQPKQKERVDNMKNRETMFEFMEILNTATEIYLRVSDGVIDENDRARFCEIIAPKLAKLYKKEHGVPVEQWEFVLFLVQLAQETIKIINERDI